MSLWYDKNKKSYASNGHGSWVKLYAEHLFDVLKEEIFSKLAGHYAGNEGKHQAEDILCDGASVKEKIEEFNQDITNKVNKEIGMGLSQNSYSDADKNKLAGIEAGAEVNLIKSVAGKTGNVTLSKTDVGLDNVDNTADINKPVSKPVQTALNSKITKPTLIDLTMHNLTADDILAGNYLDNCFRGTYTIKYGVTRMEGNVDSSEYNYAHLEVKTEYSNIDFHDIRCLQEISFSISDNNATDDNVSYIQQKYTRLYSDFNGRLSWSDWKKDISYQEIICDQNLLDTKLFNNCFSFDGQLERYVIRGSFDNQVKGELTVIFTGTSNNLPENNDFRFYTQVLEIFGNNDHYTSTRNISRYVRTFGKYEENEVGTPYFLESWSEWVPVGQNIPYIDTNKNNISLVNNKEYYLSNITDLTLTFPTDMFESWLSVTFADTGAISLNFPENARYIGYAPLPENGETWEISVKNGVVVGAKVGDGNE